MRRAALGALFALAAVVGVGCRDDGEAATAPAGDTAQAAASASVSPTASATTEESGSATVRVVIEPPLEGAHRFVFTGSPAGGLTVRPGKIGRVTTGPVAAGGHDSTLVQIDPDVEDAGYTLTAIRCDDTASAHASSGDLEKRTASLLVEDGKEVTCDFVFSPADR